MPSTKKRTVITGTCSHGKMLFAAVKDPRILRSYAKDIAEMLSEGFTFSESAAPIKFDGDCDECRKVRHAE